MTMGSDRLLLFVLLVPIISCSAFLPCCLPTQVALQDLRFEQKPITRRRFSRIGSCGATTPPGQQQQESVAIHPAVQGWPEKYTGAADSSSPRGPHILHPVFTVEPASEYLKYQLDVDNWPTWTTGDKPKWGVGNQVVDKVMPYGELSYMVSGQLEIIPTGTTEPVIVKPGDFVTFPKDFCASWKVLEELTWHYYLY